MQTEGICPWSNMVNAEFYDVTIIYQSMSEFRQTGFLGQTCLEDYTLLKTKSLPSTH